MELMIRVFFIFTFWTSLLSIDFRNPGIRESVYLAGIGVFDPVLIADIGWTSDFLAAENVLANRPFNDFTNFFGSRPNEKVAPVKHF